MAKSFIYRRPIEYKCTRCGSAPVIRLTSNDRRECRCPEYVIPDFQPVPQEPFDD